MFHHVLVQLLHPFGELIEGEAAVLVLVHLLEEGFEVGLVAGRARRARLLGVLRHEQPRQNHDRRGCQQHQHNFAHHGSP
jgi:hypothetical protein